MAKKSETDDTPQEGDREEGEPIPRSDDEVIIAEDAPLADPPPPEDDELVDVVMSGRSFKVTKEVAESYEAQMSSHETEMSTLRQPEPEPARSDDEAVPYSELLYTDPDGAIKRLKEEIKEEVRAEYSDDQGRKTFWDGFYRDNPELHSDDTYVQATLNKHWAVLSKLHPDVASTKLAELTKEGILNMASKYGGGGKRSRNNTEDLEGSLQGANETPPTPDKAKEPSRPQSLGDVIRNRNRARAKARSGASAEAK